VAEFFLALAIYKTAVVVGLWHYHDIKNKNNKTTSGASSCESNKKWTGPALVKLSYTLIWGLLLTFYPQLFGPRDMAPPLDDAETNITAVEETLLPPWQDDVQIVTFRFQGATLLAGAFTAWDQRHGLLPELTLLSLGLSMVALGPGALDSSSSSSSNQQTLFLGATLAFHYMFLTYMAYDLGYGESETTSRGQEDVRKGMILVHNESHEALEENGPQHHMVPDLATEYQNETKKRA